MGTVEVASRLVAGVGLILANGFFVAIEFALTRARQYSADEFDDPGLRRAWEMTDDLEVYLTSCQVGITATSIAVGVVAEPALASLFEPWFVGSRLAGIGLGGLVAFVIINLVHLTHGEQTPTYLGVERSKFVCRYGATPLYYFAQVISPVIRIGDGVAKWTLGLFGVEMTGAWLETEPDRVESRGDLRTRLGSVLEAGDLPEERRREVLSALDIGRVPVSDAMIDRSSIVALSTADDAETNLRRMEDEPHTRYPLVGETLADFRGVVYVPETVAHREALAAGEIDFEAVAAPPMTVAADTSVSDAIDRFQDERQELALVVADDGTEVVGLLTVTDAVEVVMGELRDPVDERVGT